MCVLTKIFGEYPQVKILEVFVDHFDEELSIPDIMWLTDISKTTVKQYISKLLNEKIILKEDESANTQLYCLNKQKQEVQIVISLVNYIVSDKLAERLEERGLEPY